MSIADAAIIAEAVRSALNGYGRNSKRPGSRKPRAGARARKSLPPGTHHRNFQIDQTYNGAARDGINTELLLIDQGYLDKQRTGRVIKCRLFEINLYFGLNGSTTPTVIKFDLILDKQPDGIKPFVEDIFDAAPDRSASGLRDLHNEQRFKFLMSRTYTVSTYDPAKSLVTKIPLNFMTTYEEKVEPPTTLTQIATNNLLFVTRCLDITGNMSGAVHVEGQVRVLYTD